MCDFWVRGDVAIIRKCVLKAGCEVFANCGGFVSYVFSVCVVFVVVLGVY